MAQFLTFLAFPAILLAMTMTHATAFFRGFGPVPVPVPFLPLMPLPLTPFPLMPPLPRRQTTRQPRTNTRATTTTTSEVMAINPVRNERRGDVIVVINDRDCYNGFCRGLDGMGVGGMGPNIDLGPNIAPGAGFMDGMNLMRSGPIADPGLAPRRNNYHISDADQVVIGGNTPF